MWLPGHHLFSGSTSLPGFGNSTIQRDKLCFSPSFTDPHGCPCPDHHVQEGQEIQAFVVPLETFKIMFWGIFALLAKKSHKVRYLPLGDFNLEVKLRGTSTSSLWEDLAPITLCYAGKNQYPLGPLPSPLSFNSANVGLWNKLPITGCCSRVNTVQQNFL